MAISVRFHSPYLQPYAQDPMPLILSALGSAQSSLDLCIPHLSLEPVVERVALLRARGVVVRWLIDFGSATPKEVGTTERLLAKHGFHKIVDWRAHDTRKAGLPQKLFIVDGRRVLAGSMPLTGEGVYLCDTLEVLVDSAEIGQAYVHAINSWWETSGIPNHVRHGTKGAGISWSKELPELLKPVESVVVGPDQRVSAYFAPYDGSLLLEKLVEVISQAEREVSFAFPSLLEPRLVEALEDRARAGVYITGVLDEGHARPEHLAQAESLRGFVASGRIRSMRNFGESDGMEVKALTVDGQVVWTGSPDFGGEGSSPYQRENGMVIESRPVARQCAKFIESLHELACAGGHKRENCRNYLTYQSLQATGASGAAPKSGATKRSGASRAEPRRPE